MTLGELPVDAFSVELVDIAHFSGAVQARHIDQHANQRLELLLGANRARVRNEAVEQLVRDRARGLLKGLEEGFLDFEFEISPDEEGSFVESGEDIAQSELI